RLDADRVVDHQIGRDERSHGGGVPAELFDSVAHRGQVDDGRYAGEVLHQDPGRHEGDLPVGATAVPAGEELDVLSGDADAVLVAEQVLQQHLHAEGETADRVPERVEAVDLQRPVSDRQRGSGVEAVACGRLGHAGL